MTLDKEWAAILPLRFFPLLRLCFMQAVFDCRNQLHFDWTPTESTLLNMVKSVPEGFRFALKANQKITHIQRLRGCEATLKRFLEVASVLNEGDHLGPILGNCLPISNSTGRSSKTSWRFGRLLFFLLLRCVIRPGTPRKHMASCASTRRRLSCPRPISKRPPR